MALRTETNTPEMGGRIDRAFTASGARNEHMSLPGEHAERDCFFEHGQWWTECVCGAQWSVVDASGGPSVDGFDFERVSQGDAED